MSHLAPITAPYVLAGFGKRLLRSLNQRIPMRSIKLMVFATMIIRSAFSQP